MRPFHPTYSFKALLTQYSLLLLLPLQCSSKPLSFLPLNEGGCVRLSLLDYFPQNHSLQSMIHLYSLTVPHQAQYMISG